MKKIISILLTLVMIAGIAALGAESASAASNTSTPFKQGRIVACGKYLFSLVYRDGESTKYLYRTDKSGKNKKLISKKAYTQSELFTYNGKVYYSANDKLMYYNAKTLKGGVFRKTPYEPVGICAKGVITYNAVNGIRLWYFSGGCKKIADGRKFEYAGANKSYVFYTKSVKFNSSTNIEKIRLYRFSLSKKTRKALGTFTIKEYASGKSGRIVDFHAFPKRCIFVSGSYSGSMGLFTGSAFIMKPDGTKIKKVKDSVDNEIMAGKKCVYIKSTNTSGKNNVLYRITATGKISKAAKDKDYVKIQATTSGNLSLTNKAAEYTGSGTCYDLYANKKVSSGTGKLVIKCNSLIKKVDYGDAFASCEVEDTVGNMALVCARCYTYEGASGWRPRTYRTIYYLVNVKTGAKEII